MFFPGLIFDPPSVSSDWLLRRPRVTLVELTWVEQEWGWKIVMLVRVAREDCELW